MENSYRNALNWKKVFPWWEKKPRKHVIANE